MTFRVPPWFLWAPLVVGGWGWARQGDRDEDARSIDWLKVRQSLPLKRGAWILVEPNTTEQA